MERLPLTQGKLTSIRNYFHDGLIDFKFYLKYLSDLYEESLILKGLVKIVDPTGTAGEVISILGKKLESLEKERINKFLHELEMRTSILQVSKLDKNFVNSDEFVEVFFRILSKVRREYRNEKIKYFSNILINYCGHGYSNDFYKEGIIDRISNYSVEHILVLQKAYILHTNNKSNGQSVDFEYNEDFGVSQNVAGICISTLYSDGFLERGFFGGYFVTDYGVKCVELIKEQ